MTRSRDESKRLTLFAPQEPGVKLVEPLRSDETGQKNLYLSQTRADIIACVQCQVKIGVSDD